jgi:hypothetical protein
MHPGTSNLPALLAVAAGVWALGTAPARADLAEDYEKIIKPLLVKKCYDCHDNEQAKADLNLERFADFEAIKAEPEVWQLALERVQAYEMPPKKSGELNYGEFERLAGFLRKLPKPAAVDCNQLASDRTASYYRGYVMSRRLNRAEYLNTVRDLFGVAFDRQLERLLPTDGGGGEGFDTTGDTLFISSIHIEKYLAAAEQITQAVLPDRTRRQDRELRAARERILFKQPGLRASRLAAAGDDGGSGQTDVAVPTRGRSRRQLRGLGAAGLEGHLDFAALPLPRRAGAGRGRHSTTGGCAARQQALLLPVVVNTG